MNGQRAYAIKEDNTLWTWGYNERGVLGAGDSLKIYTPQQVLSDVVKMKIEHHTVYAIDSSNRLWYWGTIAQFPTTLVNGSSNSPIPNVPTLLMNNVTDVDGLLDQNVYRFDSHMTILGADNQVYTYGSNYYGQLGTRDTLNNYVSPGKVDFQEKMLSSLQVVGDNMTGTPVAYNQRLEVRFNTNISATRDFSGVALMDQAGQPVAIDRAYVDGNTLFVEPGELEYGKTYTLVVPKTAVYDKTGFNEIISSDYSAMFVTNAYITPQIMSVTPDKPADILVGETVTWRCEASGVQLKYYWKLYKDGVLIHSDGIYTSGKENFSYTVNGAGVYQARVYVIDLKLKSINTYSARTYSLNESYLAPQIMAITTDRPTDILVGETVTWRCEASGVQLKYYWKLYKDGVLIHSDGIYTSGKENFSYTVNEAGVYQARVYVIDLKLKGINTYGQDCIVHTQLAN
ncbi:MAG: Ig-like domain-containing protein [Youngiibacter sp.]|nr:Ig-like domain-containing protein [Youngiibacter sp.]